jgi:hypothetical protein
MSILMITELSHVCGGHCEADRGFNWVGCEIGWHVHDWINQIGNWLSS